MAKFLGYVEVGLVGCRREFEFEIEDEALEGLSEDERDKIIDEDGQEAMWNEVEWGWKRLPDEVPE